MEVAIVFSALCTIEDCAGRCISRWLLAGGFVIGLLTALPYGFTGMAAGLLPGALLLGYAFLTEGKVGQGDGYMVMILGLLLGWELCTAALASACLLTAMFAGIGLIRRKMTRHTKICFAPFLLLALFLLWLPLCAAAG